MFCLGATNDSAQDLLLAVESLLFVPRLRRTVSRLSVSDFLPTTVFVSLSNTANPNQGSEENLVLMLSGPMEELTVLHL